MPLMLLWMWSWETSPSSAAPCPGSLPSRTEVLPSPLTSSSCATGHRWIGRLSSWPKLTSSAPLLMTSSRTRSTSSGSKLRTKLGLASPVLPHSPSRSWIPSVSLLNREKIHHTLNLTWIEPFSFPIVSSWCFFPLQSLPVLLRTWPGRTRARAPCSWPGRPLWGTAVAWSPDTSSSAARMAPTSGSAATPASVPTSSTRYTSDEAWIKLQLWKATSSPAFMLCSCSQH